MPVSFVDNSTGASTWNYTFGDTYTSTSQSPIHIYTVANNYTVQQNVTNSTGEYAISTKYINLTSDVDSNVVSWMHFNTSTTLDQQGNAWTNTGTSISNGIYKFGGGSLSFSAAGQHIGSASSPSWNIGNNPFDLEFWIYPVSTAGTSNIISRTNIAGAGTTTGWAFTDTLTGYEFWMGNIVNASMPFSIPVSQWSHISIGRNSSGYVNIYENGNFIESSYQPGNFDIADQIRIGYGSGIADDFYMDEFRMSANTPRFISAFSPPYAQYNGNLYPVYPNINANATIMNKAYPDLATTVYNITPNNIAANPAHIRTMQIQNVTNATSITVSSIYPPQFEMAEIPYINSTALATWPDMQITGISMDTINGIESYTVSRIGGGFNSIFLNRTSLVDQPFLYYNYTIASGFDQYFTNATITDGQHGVTYPVLNYYISTVPTGTWTIYSGIIANKTTTAVGSPVQFTDTSVGEPTGFTNYNWNFGDGRYIYNTKPVLLLYKFWKLYSNLYIIAYCKHICYQFNDTCMLM